MTSLSKVLKSPFVTPDHQVKLIEPNKYVAFLSNKTEDESSKETSPEITQEANQILSDAMALAEKQLQTARTQIEQLRATAKLEIESWWEARRLEDDSVIASHREQGYSTGFQEGLTAGKEQAYAEFMPKVEEAIEVLNKAYAAKQVILGEAEPFLVELSTAVARKILEKELQTHPEQVLGIIGKALARIRGQQMIVLSVHPHQFTIVQDSREELLRLIDHEAELKIIPDPAVDIGGCLIRNALGTIDARIDTQLKEIKKGLLEMVGSTDEDNE